MSPEFGGSANESDQSRFEKSGHYKDGKFENQIPTSMDMGFVGMVKTLKDFIVGVPNSKPDFEFPLEKIDSLDLIRKHIQNAIDLVWAFCIFIANGWIEYFN